MCTAGRIATDTVIANTAVGTIVVIRAATCLRAKTVVTTDFAHGAACVGAGCLALTVATYPIA